MRLVQGPKKETETDFFIPETHEAGIRKRYTETIERAKAKIAVAEVPGTCLKRRLQRSDPLRERSVETIGIACCVQEGVGV